MADSHEGTSRHRRRPELGRRKTSGGLKFKHTSSNLSTFAFAKDQTWVNQSSQDEILFIDQTGKNQDEAGRRAQSKKRQRASHQSDHAIIHPEASTMQNELAQQSTSSFIAQDLGPSPKNASPGRIPSLQQTVLRRSLSFPNDAAQSPEMHISPRTDIQRTYSNSTHSDVRSQASPATSAGHGGAPGCSNHITPTSEHNGEAAWLPSVDNEIGAEAFLPELPPSSSLYTWPGRFSALESACLMRINMLLLAKWADAGHPARHFSDTMPHLAQTFQPLLNAILTCGATQLLSTPAYKTSRGIIRYQGVLLPAITREATIRCHDACVADLLEYCNESGGVHDDQVLAALTMLRYHEELLSITDQGEDRGQLLRIFNTFSTARNLYDPPPPSISAQISITDHYFPYFNSVRYSILRLALRQELTSAYVSQTPIQMNLSPWLPLDQISHSSPHTEVFWSDKCLLHCVKVTNFCYSSAPTSPTPSSSVSWTQLKQVEQNLESTLPAFSRPLHYQRHHHPTTPFPLIWHANPLPIMGVQWLGLAKLLLAVFNPTLPRIGAGLLVAQDRLATEVRGIIRTICGIALSNPEVQPAYVHAQMAIMAGGVYFRGKLEQDAMLKILAHLEWEFGWPTHRDRDRLVEIWGRETWRFSATDRNLYGNE